MEKKLSGAKKISLSVMSVCVCVVAVVNGVVAVVVVAVEDRDTKR